MNKIKLAVTGLLSILFLSVAVLVAINLFDSKFDPELIADKDVLTHPPDASATEGYKYLLGFFVSPDLDPAVEGERIYERAKTNSKENPSARLLEPSDLTIEVKWSMLCDRQYSFFDKKFYEENKQELEQCLTDSHILLQRFDKLIEIGSFAVDILPNTTYSIPHMKLLKVMRLKRLQLNTLWYQNREQEMLNNLEKINAFLNKSLNYPSYLITSMILLSDFKTNRTFFEELIKQNPTFKDIATEDMKKSFVLQTSFEALLERIIEFESKAFRHFWLSDVHGNIARMNFENAENLTITQRLSNSVQVFLLKPNETSNRFYAATHAAAKEPCVYNEQPCEQKPFVWYKNLRNPVGRNLAYQLSSVLHVRFKKLHEYWKELSQPLPL